MHARLSLVIAVILGAATGTTSFGEATETPLARRGCLGAQVVGAGDGVLVVGVVPDGPALQAGIRPTDRIVAVNGHRIAVGSASSYLRGHADGEEVTITVERSGQEMEVRATLAAPRTPDLPGAFTEFGEVRLTDGTRVRSIFTAPFPESDRPQPAVFFIQHTDCATVDPEVAQSSGWFDLIETVAQSGFITMRVDKPGVGDSEGPECGTLDYLSELDVYRAALASLLADPRVDPTRVFLIANRGGTTIAPVLAREADFAGVCAIGPIVRPWFEHTLDLMRRQSRDWDMPPMQSEKMLHDCAELLARVILLGQEPAEVVREYPALAPLAQSLGGDRLFGRSPAFHRQLNDADLAAAWSMIETDVLVLRGEFDRYSTPGDQELVARLVNGPTGSRAWTATIPKTDPELSPQDSPDYYKIKWSAIVLRPNPELRETVLDWLDFASASVPASPLDDGADPGQQAEREAEPKPAS